MCEKNKTSTSVGKNKTKKLKMTGLSKLKMAIALKQKFNMGLFFSKISNYGHFNKLQIILKIDPKKLIKMAVITKLI